MFNVPLTLIVLVASFTMSPSSHVTTCPAVVQLSPVTAPTVISAGIVSTIFELAAVEGPLFFTTIV